MRKLMVLGAVLGLGMVAPASAHAAVNTGVVSPLCIFWGSYSACASVLVDTDNGEITVRNLSGVQGNTFYKLTGFGFYYWLPDAQTAITLGNMKTGWELDADGGLNGVIGGEAWVGGASTINGVNNALGNGESYTWSFAPDTEWDKLYFGWRGQAWKDGAGADVGSTSIKCFQTGEASTNGQEGAYCGPPTVVPEPATMALLATGLVGLGGAGLIRRRRKS